MIIITIIVLLLVYQIPSVKSVVNNAIPKMFLNGILNKKFDKYAYLNENTTTSENYKIIKLINRFNKKPILFDRINENFIFTGDSGYLTTIRKVNNKGEEIDSLKIKGALDLSGIYFYDDYFIDWAITGNKSKQKYDTIINYDTLSKKEFKNYLSKADIIDYTYASGEELESGWSAPLKARCYLKIQDKWMVITSKKMLKELEKDYETDYYDIIMDNKNLFKKNVDRLVPLKNSKALSYSSYDWKKQDNLIFIQKFNKETYIPWTYSINGGRGSGWDGTAYFQWIHKSEILNFKAYTFKPSRRFSSLSPKISIYYPDKKYNIDLAFIHLHSGPESKRSFSESGIYVLKNKRY
ncbi:MAG: hypothetical protein L3J20_13830 [Flavobacteriaceae bacterium]|nr:hypothetical protein [Flavobacteriaceae bacterium]